MQAMTEEAIRQRFSAIWASTTALDAGLRDDNTSHDQRFVREAQQ